MVWSKKRGDAGTARSEQTMIFVISVFFGFAAGLVGGLFSSTYLLPTEGSPVPTLTVWRARGAAAELRSAGDSFGAPAAIADQSAALFFAAKPVSGDPLKDVYLPDDAVAGGAVLTSDGWLLTAGSVLTAPKGKPAGNFVAAVGGRVYPVERVVRDPYSGAVFAKIAAANLPVVSFGDAASLVPGESVYAFGSGYGLERLGVLGFGSPVGAKGQEQLLSSESLERYLRLQGTAPLPGAAVMNARGEAVAVFGDSGPDALLAAPLGSFVDRMSAILGSQGIERPLLGIRYLALGDLIGLSDTRDFLHKGALVFGSADGSVPAVARNSPAAAAGLRSGDIIVSVDGEDVTAKRPLSEIISEYDPRDRVSLTVRRGVFPGGLLAAERSGALITVEVVLGSDPGK